MRAREIAHTKRDDNRVVRPFAWGLEFITDHVNGDDPRNVLRRHTARAMNHEDDTSDIARARKDLDAWWSPRRGGFGLSGFAPGFLDFARNVESPVPQSIARFPVEFHDRNSDRTRAQDAATEVSSNH